MRIPLRYPFRRDTTSPPLRIRSATIAGPPRQIGANGRHLALSLRQDEPTGRRWLRCVWWNAGALAADLAAGMCLDAIIEPKVNTYNGRTNVEAELRDVRLCER